MKSFGRNCKTYFLPWLVNKELKNAVFEQEQTISESKRHLELTNAKLERRQETIMDLLSNISEIRMTGERHAIRGTLDKAFELLKFNRVDVVICGYIRGVQISTKQNILTLAENGIITLDDLAELDSEELFNILGKDVFANEDDAGSIIMKAREHWFSEIDSEK